MGAPQARHSAPGGETVLWYSHPSNGKGSYAARIGADGKLVSFEERLTAQNLNRIAQGVSNESAVRELLGPPHKVEEFPRQQRRAWSYNMPGTDRQMVVQFSSDGVAREAYVVDNPALASAPD